MILRRILLASALLCGQAQAQTVQPFAVGTPTQANQATPKSYVDSAVAAVLAVACQAFGTSAAGVPACASATASTPPPSTPPITTNTQAQIAALAAIGLPADTVFALDPAQGVTSNATNVTQVASVAGGWLFTPSGGRTVLNPTGINGQPAFTNPSFLRLCRITVARGSPLMPRVSTRPALDAPHAPRAHKQQRHGQ